MTDVSSVVARDLAVHLYSTGLYATPETRGSRSFVQHLMRALDADTSSLVFDFADDTHWGEPLVEDW